MSVYKFGTLKSPPRRPTVQGSEQSPFCTSPSQLQDVTLDPDSSGNRTVSFTSPGKSTPIRGRTVKEYEDLLSQLKRENFNLKLRIYFLDERMGLLNRNRVDDTEDNTKENIELKVECELLRKEVSDKQELLCQAAKALDVLEEQHRSELKKLKEQHDIEKGMLDSHIQELEKELKVFKESAKEPLFLNLKSTGTLEETELLKQQIAELKSQVVTMKLLQKYESGSSKSASTQTSTIEKRSSPGKRTDLSSDVSFKDKQLRTMEELKKEDPLRYEGTQVRIKELESQLTESASKLRKSEELLKMQKCQFNQIDEERIKAYQAIKGFMKKNNDLACELEHLKLAMEERDNHIQDLTSELTEFRNAFNKINWEAYQLPAQAHVQGSHGKPGTLENVQHITEDENERLSAELEDKKKKLVKVTTQQDNVSMEMANEVQNLRTALRDKMSRLEEFEKKYAASSIELEAKTKHIKELNEKLIEVNKKLNVVEKCLQERNAPETQDKKDSEEQKKICNLEVELEDKKEVENRNIELGNGNGSLQELLNRELWDKNKEIEHLRHGSKKKKMQITLLQQELNARYYQLHLLKEKVAELGMQVSLPTSIVLRETQQQQQDGSYFAQHMHMAGDADYNLHDQLHAIWDDKKYLCEKLEELHEILYNTPEQDSDIRALKTECTRLREELEEADCWRRGATEICSKLTQRLEELSIFLAALLKNPEQLNVLSVQRRLSLRQAAKRNMAMSHSLSVTLSTTNQDFNETILPFLKDSFSSMFVASDLNISDLLKESSDVEITGVNDEKLSCEMHVEGNNNTENASVNIINLPEPVNNLQLQVEAQQQEMEQNNKEKELPQIANKIAHASADSDSVQKSETGNNNSFSSVAFYTSRTNGSLCCYDAVALSEDARSHSNSLSDSDQDSREEIPPDFLDVVELTRHATASFQVFGTPPNLPVPKKSTKATDVNGMRRCSSAAPLCHVLPAVAKKEYVVGSLSDSEAWSEPDRSVSLARIGLSEEGANTVLLPDTNVNVGASCYRKVNQMVDTSSDSLEETTHKIIRAAGKRGENMAAEIKLLQHKLQATEHANENLRTELKLMYQLTSHGNESVLDCNQNMGAATAVGVDNDANVLKSPSKNIDINANQSGSISEIETKESKHKVELQDKSMNTSHVKESSTSTKVAENAVRSFQEHVKKLETLLKEQESKLADQQCLMIAWKEKNLEMEMMLYAKDRLKEDYRKQLEEMLRLKKENDAKLVAAVRIQEDAKIKLAEMEIELSDCRILLETEKLEKVKALRFQENAELKLAEMETELRDFKTLVECQKLEKLEVLKNQEDVKIKLAEIQIELSDYKMLVERHNLEKVELQKEKEENVKTFEIMLREVNDQKDEIEYQNREVRKEMQKAELQKLEAERMVMKMQEVSEKFKEDCKKHAKKVIGKHKRDLEVQLQLKVSEEQQKLEDLYRKDVEATKSDYEAKIKQHEKEVQKKAEDKIKELEEEHKKTVIHLLEENERCVISLINLQKELDEAILSNSKLALEKTRVANEKLHLEKELRKQEALKCDLIQEKKEAENTLAAVKKRMGKRITDLQQVIKDKRRLTRAVQDLQLINDELLKRLCAPGSRNLATGNQGDTISGNESKTLSSFSPGSLSSGLDGGSTGPVSLETNISVGDDQSVGPECLSTLPNSTLEQGIPRQQSDDMPGDQPLEGYEAVFSEMRKAEVDGKSVWITQQHTTTLSSNARTLTSPDLGIESDQGRFSSLEASSSAPPEIRQTEANDTRTKDYTQLQKENIMLKQRLYRSNNALEQALTQLSEANQRKKEVEKAISKQLDKTHAILKNTRENLEEKPEEPEEQTK